MSTQVKLISRFCHYRALLAENEEVYYDDDRIDLDSIVGDYPILDCDGKARIQYIPLKGNYVYVTCTEDCKETTTLKVSLRSISEDILRILVEIMRKAMIIQELKTSIYTYARPEADNG